MKTSKSRRSARMTQYLVVWWMARTPYAAVFDHRIAAETAASVRNALVVAVSGRNLRIEGVWDWYRRDETGEPMPAEWRDLVGQIHVPEERHRGRSA
ncbi:MAG TPA: hypothetical protein HA326_03395 [Thermoplasmata archaeon]|nr:hypothetical protein [Thermoplasmata archaeon]